MADVITRFKLETTQYDSKLRDAAKGLQEFVRTAENGGKGFTNFSQKALESARALGQTASGATNLKDKVKDLVGAYNDAAKAYNKLSQEQQQSDFGKALAQSIEQLGGRIKEAKSELYSLGDVAQQTGGKMQGVLGAVVGGRGGMVGNIAAQLGATKTQLLGISAAVAGAGAAFKLLQDNVSTALNFEKSMSQLSSLTGMVGGDLEKLKGYAIELGSSTTLSASQVADAFKMIGSQQPQLLESGEALKQVTKYAITLSEAAGIELSTAAQTLSTSINQMGGDSANASRYINVLAAASQKGAGDIAWLGEALTKSATAAKAVGTDYEELVANLEQLAKAGFDASTSGTALRSIIMNLEKQANNDFKPSIVGLTQAFQNLADAHLTISGYQDIVGKMFATQAMALANAAGEAKNMTAAITGTNTAEEQAKTNTDNLEGSLKSLSSAWEGLNLHLNSSNGYLRTVVDWLKDVVVWADKAVVGLGEVTGNRNQLNNEGGGGNTRVDRQINTLSNTNINRRQAIYSQQVEKYWRFINDWEKKLKEAENRTDVFAWETIKKNNDIAKAKDNIAGAKSMLSEYQQRSGGLLTQSSGSGGGNTKTTINVDADTEEAKKSIKELQAEIKKLKALRDDAASTGNIEMRDQYNSQIKSIEAQIKARRGGGTTTSTKTPKTEEQLNNEQIGKLTQEYIKATDERRKAIEAEIKGLQQRNEEIQKLKDIALGKFKDDGSLPALTRQLQDLQKKQAESADGKEWDEYQKKIEEVTDKINVMKGVLPKDQQATFTLNVNAEQLEQLQMLLPTDDKTIKVNVEQGKVDLPSVPTDDKTIKVNVEQGKVDLPSVPTDDKTIKVNVEQGKVDLPSVPTDDKTIKVNVEQGKVDLPSVPTDDKTIKVNITADTADAMKQVRDLVSDIEGMDVVIEPKVEIQEQDLRTPFEKLQDSIRIQIAEQNIEVDTNTLQTLMKAAIENGIDSLNPDFASLQEKMREGINIPDETWKALQDKINAKLKELGIEPIKIDFSTGNVKKQSKEMAKDWEYAAQAVRSVGSAMSAIEDPSAKIIGTIGEAIANIALGFAMATAKDTKLGVWGWIAAVAGGLATMVSTISAIHSATGYANGGEIKGNSYSGDNLMAMGPDGGLIGLNAGEIVLSKSMQSTLANNLQGNGGHTVRVVGKISGSDILLSADRTLKTRGKQLAVWNG